MSARRSIHVLAMIIGVASLVAFGSATTGRAQTGPKTSDLAFLAADTNGDGFVDEAELGADQAKRFHSLDANRDGFLTPDELVDADPAAFRRLDTNGDGRLSFQEVMAGKLEDFRRADTNGDGRLSLDEVMRFEASK
ncbi:EF-hand domain-containing protein [Benzoatithermus flavus]|uniref:EF-hand domain-containing protein n=1 Tax=Benzoatithermus flavus TaxID=3108223 RepID=A0ABU8XRK2_9PROT